MGLFSKLFKKSNDTPADQAATPTDTAAPADPAAPVAEAPTPEAPQTEAPAAEAPAGQDPNNPPAAQ